MATSTTISTETCPECHGRIQTDATEAVCGDCGLVIESDRIDHGPDWGRADEGEQTQQRATPGNRNYGDRGLGSEMSYREDYETEGQRRRRRINRHAKRSATDRTRAYATTEIQRVAVAVGLDRSLAEQAKTVFRQYHDDGHATGEDVDTLAPASVYLVARTHTRGLTAADVAQVARNGDGRTIWRCARRVARRVGLKVPPPSVETRVRVVGEDTTLSDGAVERAARRASELSGEFVAGVSPSVLAAALLYADKPGMATQQECADAAGCSVKALRTQYHRLRKRQD